MSQLETISYDEFKIGDRVWSEAYGFGNIEQMRNGYSTIILEKHIVCITSDGFILGDPSCARRFFHAVAGTDEGMRAAIARGEGLKRPDPRGRWPIEPGDRVTYVGAVDSDYGVVEAVGKVEGLLLLSVKFGAVVKYLYEDGRASVRDSSPSYMRLYDGEGIYASNERNLRRITDEAIKFGWYEKYGNKNKEKE